MNPAKALLLLGSIILLMLDSRSLADTDVVHLNTRFETIDNFGASDAWTISDLATWSEANKNKVANLLFSTDRGIGLSLWRFNIGGGINRVSIRRPDRSPETFETAEGQYDWNRQAAQQWFARAARDRGVPYLLGFVNSPPGRMTRNGLTNSGDDDASTTNLKPGFEPQFATYLCDIVQHFGDVDDPSRKLIFNYISPVNEPENDWVKDKQEGNRCSNDDIKKIIFALHRELLARHLDTRIRAVESCTVSDLLGINQSATAKWHAPYGDYLRVFLGDPSLAAMIDHTLCYHDYSSFYGNAIEADHRALGKSRSQYPNSKLWMSEICILSAKRDVGMPTAIQIAKLIHANLVLANASAWQWWLAISNVDARDGLLYTDWQKPGDPESLITTKSLWAVGNFSRFVRPGMQRIELRGEHHSFDGLLGSAYIDPSSQKLVLVYINAGHDAREVRWIFQGSGLSPTSFTPYVTSETSDLEQQPLQSAAHSVEIPAQSIVTFVGNP